MSTESDEVTAAASELTHAMSRLVRAIDAGGNDGDSAGAIPEKLPEELERLAARLNAARGFSG
jgi:hypothetical protein